MCFIASLHKYTNVLFWTTKLDYTISYAFISEPSNLTGEEKKRQSASLTAGSKEDVNTMVGTFLWVFMISQLLASPV